MGRRVSVNSENSKNPEQLYQIIEYLAFNDKLSINYFNKYGNLLPANTGVYKDQVFHKPDDCFGGMNLLELQCELVREIPEVRLSQYFWPTLATFNELYPELYNGDVTVEEFLQKVQEQAIADK